MNIKEKQLLIRERKLLAVDNIKSFLEKIKKEDKSINSFIYVAEKEALEQAKIVDKKIRENKKVGRLAGLAVAVKSCINVKGMPITCASRTLKKYVGTYDADVIKKIKEEDGIIIGMTNMDEFACGSSGETSAYGLIQNPVAKGRIPGGSSSGSTAAVAAGFCDIALGTDTGGSIRNPASHCGVVGIKPSYGRVSRYGLVDLSMSLDQIGPLCKDVYGAALMLEVIAGKSDKDSTTYEEKTDSYSSFKNIKNLKVGLSKDFESLCVDKRIYELIMKKVAELIKKTNSNILNVDLKHVKLAVQTYYPLVYVEFFSGTRKFDGRRYGEKIENSCGEEVLRRILGGREISRAEYGGQYYRKSLAAKKEIAKDLEEAFKKVDVIITPVTPKLPHKIGEKVSFKDMYAYDAFTIPANLAGICAGVIPAGTIDGVPVGLQVMAPAFKEKLLFEVLNSL
ncbi:MAG: Asp-tRNA(Asn)/Glu-tRNA(Gln) amidotransferase subunit GatA [Nanoarchaeota archaeon]|nr:Asp-tRNA(Asn)/Glu-tRNA(Gln) amidotransferase subunit GatA [Nanoarchaeota archaeon]MBU1269710.1 Asp-tRNA(Asn)/Glu-tRNA(Gln) amidotransferase subunit GatA [Nanoarchaeota archaeon]MBU1604011.1 Asp-tRNA(Asn)/Glu-tRNA(Gln) amidotransferase subunit GatA [Nanoarchaeota archaeon]MBU2442528.1 Asp-tRNA(Asn)/Glu-tRNA(Gln) amidotransferase subunit GatA [Nanoarchaeota archaeon]